MSLDFYPFNQYLIKVPVGMMPLLLIRGVRSGVYSEWRYRFRDRPTPPDEFLQYWYASFTKNSMHGIDLTKVMDQGLVYVHKTFMRQTTFDGKRNFNIKKIITQKYEKPLELMKNC